MICWTAAFSILSLTGTFIILGSLGIIILVVGGIKIWFRVDDLANTTEPLTRGVAELKERVEGLEQKIKDD